MNKIRAIRNKPPMRDTEKKSLASSRSELTTQGLIRGLAEHIAKINHLSFPLLNDRVWHDFFYRFKHNQGAKFPELKCLGRFNHLRGYPFSPQLNEALFHLKQFFVEIPEEERAFFNPRHIRPKNLIVILHPLLIKNIFSAAIAEENFLKKMNDFEQ